MFTWAPLLWCWGAASVVMFGLFAVAVRRQNANWVDVGWALCLGGMAVAYALIGPGSGAQRALAGVVGGVWGLRLTAHLLLDRTVGQPEDGRYRHLRAHWGASADLHFAWFFQAQAVLAVLLSVPFLMIASHVAAEVAPLQWVGVGLFVVAKAGESIADAQLARFRREPANRGTTCRTGLWRLSRHPNYFFEWLIWCAFALIATPVPHGWLAWLAPAAMYLLITRVTGIPYTEAQSLRSRGDDYRRYQRTTNAFFPGPPRADDAGGPSTAR